MGTGQLYIQKQTEEEGREKRAMTSEYRATHLHFSRKKTMHKESLKKKERKKSLYCSVSGLSTGNTGWSKSQEPTFVQRLLISKQ